MKAVHSRRALFAAQVTPLENRCLLASDFTVTLTDVTGDFLHEYDEGSYQFSWEDIEAEIAWLGMTLDRSAFDGFDELVPESTVLHSIEVYNDAMDPDLTLENYSSSSATFSFHEDSVEYQASLAIVSLNRMSMSMTTSPSIGRVEGYLDWSGTMPAEGRAGVYQGQLFVNGTAGEDELNVEYMAGAVRVSIPFSSFDQTFQQSSYGVIVVDGLAGNDHINVDDGLGLVSIDGGDGNDRITIWPSSSTSEGRASIFGGNGNDEITAGSGKDSVNGAAGNDAIIAGGGDDLVIGGTENDTLTGGAGKDKMYGGDGNDRLRGNGGNDVIYGDAGSDRLYGGNQNDYLDAGAHTDRAWGEAGNDILIGGSSNDKLYGGDGDDYFDGGKGSDLIDGGANTDRCRRDDADTRISIEILA